MFLWLVTLTLDLMPPEINGFQYSSLNISMSRLVILAASVFEISCGKQTDRQTNGGKIPAILPSRFYILWNFMGKKWNFPGRLRVKYSMEFSCQVGKNVQNSTETPWDSAGLRDSAGSPGSPIPHDCRRRGYWNRKEVRVGASAPSLYRTGPPHAHKTLLRMLSEKSRGRTTLYDIGMRGYRMKQLQQQCGRAGQGGLALRIGVKPWTTVRECARSRLTRSAIRDDEDENMSVSCEALVLL